MRSAIVAATKGPHSKGGDEAGAGRSQPGGPLEENGGKKGALRGEQRWEEKRLYTGGRINNQLLLLRGLTA